MSLEGLSFAELVSQAQILLAKIIAAINGYYAWAVGTVNGGPEGDGRYPLPVPGAPGFVLLPCPAAIAASAAPFTAETITSLPAAIEATGAEPYAAIDVDGVLKKFTPNLYAARKTADLFDISRLTGDELLPALTEAGPSGLEKRIALRELHRKLTGVINPKMPPYNCKGDFQISKGATTYAGQNIVICSEPMFRASDLGKLIYVSNNYDATINGNYQSTITEFISTTQVRCARNFVADVNYAELAWGTDDTAGMQAAINACRSPGSFTYGGCVLLPPGMYLCGPMTYPARMSIKGAGRRQSMLVRKPHPPSISYDTHQLINETALDDFNVFSDWGLHGLRYQQNKGGIGFGFYSVDSSQVTAQNDPYPYWSSMVITEQTYHGMETYNRHSGDIIAMEIVGCFGAGMNIHSYDINMVNILTIGNSGPGMNLESGGCNINNLKSSYNGVNGYMFEADEGNCNLLVKGSGNNITNARLQESLGSSLVVTGYFNKFGDMSLEDPGCIGFEHPGSPPPPTLRAALYLKGPNCVGNILNDVSYGRAVHEFGSHMTHAVFLSGDCSNNKGRMWERPGSTYDSSKVGTDSSGGIGVSNKITIDGTPII